MNPACVGHTIRGIEIGEYIRLDQLTGCISELDHAPRAVVREARVHRRSFPVEPGRNLADEVMACPTAGGIFQIHGGVSFKVRVSHRGPCYAGHVHQHRRTVENMAGYAALIAECTKRHGHILALIGALVVGQTQGPRGRVHNGAKFRVLLCELIARERRLLGDVIPESDCAVINARFDVEIAARRCGLRSVDYQAVVRVVDRRGFARDESVVVHA